MNYEEEPEQPIRCWTKWLWTGPWHIVRRGTNETLCGMKIGTNYSNVREVAYENKCDECMKISAAAVAAKESVK